MRRRAPGPIFVADTMRAAFLLEMFAQQPPGARIEQAHIHRVPLHVDLAADPARRRTIVGRVDFNTAIDMNRPFSVLVITKRLQGQRLQQGLLFGEHGRHLPLGAAVDACVGPVLFPVIEICLRLFQALKAQALQGCVLGVPDGALNFLRTGGSRDPSQRVYRCCELRCSLLFARR